MSPIKAQRELKLLGCHTRPPRMMTGVPRARLSVVRNPPRKPLPTWLEGLASGLRRIGSRLMRVGK